MRRRVTGSCGRGSDGRDLSMPARLTIAADGRRRASRAACRWRVIRAGRGAGPSARYFIDVAGLADHGEMHVRAGRYIGVAPLPGGLANVCVVTDRSLSASRPGSLIADAIRQASRSLPTVRARANGREPVMLGPLAVDCDLPGVSGLLLAGDAAGFIDPMTGDGLRFAIRGAELAAAECLRSARWRTGATCATCASRVRGEARLGADCASPFVAQRAPSTGSERGRLRAVAPRVL